MYIKCLVPKVNGSRPNSFMLEAQDLTQKMRLTAQNRSSIENQISAGYSCLEQQCLQRTASSHPAVRRSKSTSGWKWVTGEELKESVVCCGSTVLVRKSQSFISFPCRREDSSISPHLSQLRGASRFGGAVIWHPTCFLSSCQLGYLKFSSNIGVTVLERNMDISKWEKGVLQDHIY